MNDYQISYRISKNAKMALIFLYIVSMGGIIVKGISLWLALNYFDIAFLVIIFIFHIFSTASIWVFIFKKRPVMSISSKYISIAVPYFFQVANIPLANVKEVKMSIWSRSEIIFQDMNETKSLSFMAVLLSSEDRESFLSNIFDLLPNAPVR